MTRIQGNGVSAENSVLVFLGRCVPFFVSRAREIPDRAMMIPDD
jgi:hypothetical protein